MLNNWIFKCVIPFLLLFINFIWWASYKEIHPWIFPFKNQKCDTCQTNARFKWFSNDCRIFTRQPVPYLPYRVITTKSIWPESRLKRTKISFGFRSMKTSGQIFVDRWWLKNLPPTRKILAPPPSKMSKFCDSVFETKRTRTFQSN